MKLKRGWAVYGNNRSGGFPARDRLYRTKAKALKALHNRRLWPQGDGWVELCTRKD